MEVVLDVKNVPKIMNPTKNDVIVFNGKQWYLTSKESLLEEACQLVEEAKKELENSRKENKEFREKVARQLYEMSESIKKLYGDR